MFPDTLFGLNLVESKTLFGSKYAVQKGNTVYLSPAMYSLVKHANEEELEQLLKSIPVVRMPEMKWELPPVQWPGK